MLFPFDVLGVVLPSPAPPLFSHMQGEVVLAVDGPWVKGDALPCLALAFLTLGYGISGFRSSERPLPFLYMFGCHDSA